VTILIILSDASLIQMHWSDR